MAKARVSNWREAQLPLFHFSPWKGTWVEDQVDQQRNRSHLNVDGPPQKTICSGSFMESRVKGGGQGKGLGVEKHWVLS